MSGRPGTKIASTRKLGPMPTNRQANSATNASAPSTVALVEPTLPVADALANAVLGRVLQQVNLAGLREKVLDEAATRLARNVQIDKLIDRIVGQSEQRLSDQLSERVIEYVAFGTPQDAQTEGGQHACSTALESTSGQLAAEAASSS